MAQSMSSGAYIIRNRDSSAVLHTDGLENGGYVSTSERDEERHRERQIWWIEADPGFEDLNSPGDNTAKGGSVYRISIISKDISLDENPGDRKGGTPVTVHKNHGAPWHLWHFMRLTSYDDGEYYNIVSAHSGLTLHAGKDGCCTHQLDTNSKEQAWELLKPVVSVPAGWLRLQNVASRRLLSQTSPSFPPLAIPMTLSTSSFSTHHESWATQWAFTQAPAVKTYNIKNRLTGTYLRCQPSKLIHREEAESSVNAWQRSCCGKSEMWNLELDAESNWKIVHNSGFLLEEADVPLLHGYEIVCTTKTLNKRKISWAFIPPNNTIERFAGLVRDSDPNKTSISTKDGRQISPPPVNKTTRRFLKGGLLIVKSDEDENQ